MNVLHVASFRGNVGDNANHNGLRVLLREVLPQDTKFDELEMRRFYVNYDGPDRLKFDLHFAEIANRYDLVIIGGGNFFEVWIEHSSSGCTIDMPREVIDSLQTKVLFYGLGFDTYKGATPNTLSRFLDFVSALQDRSRFLVTVRNDGSYGQFVGCYGVEEADRLIKKVPDGGFFMKVDTQITTILPQDRFNVILSVAMDMENVRYGENTGDAGTRNLIDSITDFVVVAKEEYSDLHFTLMPHIYSDLSMVYSILEKLPDHIRRNQVSVGPVVSGIGSESNVFANYKNADCTVGMRFHANVCSLGFGVPTIGVSTYRKITDLFDELQLSEFVVDGRKRNCSAPLLDKVRHVRKEDSVIARKIESTRQLLETMKAETVRLLSDFILG